jgi:hypothetical protein
LALINANPQIHAGKARPAWKKSPSLEKVLARLHKTLQGKANPQHEDEVQDHDQPIDVSEVRLIQGIQLQVAENVHRTPL